MFANNQKFSKLLNWTKIHCNHNKLILLFVYSSLTFWFPVEVITLVNMSLDPNCSIDWPLLRTEKIISHNNTICASYVIHVYCICIYYIHIYFNKFRGLIFELQNYLRKLYLQYYVHLFLMINKKIQNILIIWIIIKIHCIILKLKHSYLNIILDDRNS